MSTEAQSVIRDGRAVLGIELGSTRIKAILIGPDHRPLAVGTHEWENQYVDGLWTYSLDAVWSGLQACYAGLAADAQAQHDVEVRSLSGIGVSAMMHGYLAFGADDELLTPFRTWRNTNTGQAAALLSVELAVNIPHRWSVAHLHQAILDGEPHVRRIAHLTTLAGYVHWQLTGEQVLGIGDASGIFPVAASTCDYDVAKLSAYDRLAADAGVDIHLRGLLPKVLVAGEPAGNLSEAGARRLDPTGTLRAGVPCCPPEGDAGTGMVATNCIAPRSGNVSAGTSIFAMIVLERELHRPYRELDLVATPVGDPVAMVHCNNGTSELSAWTNVFTEFAALLGATPRPADVFELLLRESLKGSADCAGLMSYNYLSGEPITDLETGRPLFFRSPEHPLDLATFVRTQLFASLATLRLGMDVLVKHEGAQLDRLVAHGGLFTTRGVGERYLAAAINTPVSVGEVAAEGGAWGIAVLAAFSVRRGSRQSLQEYLSRHVFRNSQPDAVPPDAADAAGFDRFLERFVAALPVEREAAARS